MMNLYDKLKELEEEGLNDISDHSKEEEKKKK